MLGGLLLLGAIVGAFVLPTLSDKQRKRKPYLLLGVLGSIPWLLGIILGQAYGVLLVSAFAFGFLLVGIAPIGYQYAAELTYPVPEGTSNGMLTHGRSGLGGVHLCHGGHARTGWKLHRAVFDPGGLDAGERLVNHPAERIGVDCQAHTTRTLSRQVESNCHSEIRCEAVFLSLLCC